jgi:hypothetical protein
MKLRALIADLIFGLAALGADSGAELFQKAVTQERAAGNLEEAIKLYQRIAREFASDRALAAKALVQEARCYEKLGKDNAVRIYEQVARDYKDQREPSAAASARLAALRLGEHSVPATMTQRKIELPFPNDSVPHVFETDGQRQVYVDPATGALMISDLAGKARRVLFKPKAGDHPVGHLSSRDLSIVSLSLKTVDGYKVVVIKTDGSGYREFETHSRSFGPYYAIPDWSWDDRYIFSCQNEPDGTHPLTRISVTDGEIRKTGATCGVYSLNRPSPDGRYIALGTSYMTYDKVSVVPSQGGEPQLVSDNARLIDWTRDGRYLIVAIARSSSEALYLLPVKDGRASGAAVFVRYGPCFFGSTVGSGALVCHSTMLPTGAYETWLGSLDSNGHPTDWKPMILRSGISSGYFRWSPDSTQFSYSAYEDSRPNTRAVRLHKVASGEERELYRGAKDMNCIWAAQRPALFCGEWGGQQLSVMSLDSGRLEPLGAFGAIGTLYFGSDDDRTIYLGNRQNTLFRWDAVTQQSTLVDRIPGPRPDPGEHWLARRDKDRIEVRPTAGGDWKLLISIGETQMGFTQDGKWVLYHDVDAAGKHSLFRVSTAGGQPERIGDFPSLAKERGYLFISPDGQKVIAQAHGSPELWILENFEPKQQAAR